METAILGRLRNSLYGSTATAPGLALWFNTNLYFKGGVQKSFASLLTSTASTNGTLVNSAGTVVWRAHNLALNSAAPATQGITVISGAQYTVECTGSGSVVLSGAGTGTVTEGNPVSVTASTTTLTLTVSGTVATMWAYRSDLGGMAPNPDTGSSYVPTTGSAVYMRRAGHHVYENGAWVNAGCRIETEARTNLLLNSLTLSTQSATVTAVPHTLSFTGTGTVTLSGVSTAGPLVGTGTGENNRVRLTFTPTAGSLTLTVTGTVTNAQLEAGSTPSSYIPTLGATATRGADGALTVAGADMPWSGTAVSIAVKGRMTYADTGVSQEVVFSRWLLDANNYILAVMATQSTLTGKVQFSQKSVGVFDYVETSGGFFSPSVNIPFSIASRHGTTFINGAVGGTALPADLTPVALPALSATSFQIAHTFMGTIESVRVWSDDIGNTGIASASA